MMTIDGNFSSEIIKESYILDAIREDARLMCDRIITWLERYSVEIFNHDGMSAREIMNERAVVFSKIDCVKPCRVRVSAIHYQCSDSKDVNEYDVICGSSFMRIKDNPENICNLNINIYTDRTHGINRLRVRDLLFKELFRCYRESFDEFSIMHDANFVDDAWFFSGYDEEDVVKLYRAVRLCDSGVQKFLAEEMYMSLFNRMGLSFNVFSVISGSMIYKGLKTLKEDTDYIKEHMNRMCVIDFMERYHFTPEELFSILERGYETMRKRIYWVAIECERKMYRNVKR